MRVFVVGAGAAIHAGYPLGRDLLATISTWARGKNRSDDLACLASIEERYGDLDFCDSEDVLSHLQTEPRDHAIVEFLKSCIVERFGEVLKENEAQAYQKFATRVIEPGDLIITFNYDVSLERELKRALKWEIKDGYGFSPEIEIAFEVPASKVKVLKLHGSTNWITPLAGGLSGGPSAVPPGKDYGDQPRIRPGTAVELGYPDLTPRARRAGPQQPIIMPAREKKFYYQTSMGVPALEHFWNTLWDQARIALQQAGEIYLIGYSLPTADARARYLILSCTDRRSKVTVCCGSQTSRIVGEFNAVGFSSVMEADPSRFERWVNDLI